MKCGSGLYFFSTHGNGNDTEHKSENAEKSTKSKRTPKDNLGYVTNLRRSPRIKTTDAVTLFLGGVFISLLVNWVL
jgi:hypothetical protein